MSFQLPPDLDDQVKERLATGQYESEDDVLRQALRALRWQEQETTAIQEGIDDMEAGRVRPLRESDREYRDRHKIPQDL